MLNYSKKLSFFRLFYYNDVIFNHKATKGDKMIPAFLTKTSTTKTGKRETHLRWWVSLLLSMSLAIGTWNPSGHHFVNYISTGDPLAGFRPFFILVMIALWLMAIKAVLQSIKLYGALIALAIIGAFVWGLVQYELLDTSKWSNLGWIASISMGLIIWLGLNASIMWKKATGVYTTDVTDEE